MHAHSRDICHLNWAVIITARTTSQIGQDMAQLNGSNAVFFRVQLLQSLFLPLTLANGEVSSNFLSKLLLLLAFSLIAPGLNLHQQHFIG